VRYPLLAVFPRGLARDSLLRLFSQLLKAEGVTSVLPEAFGPLAHVCKVACHPNRAMKVLKWMERESIAPTIQTVEDVVVTLCRANDVHNAAALLDNLLDPDGVASGRIASDAVIVEVLLVCTFWFVFQVLSSGCCDGR
jgi:hypothetical protein